jgi:hypothetical protein
MVTGNLKSYTPRAMVLSLRVSGKGRVVAPCHAVIIQKKKDSLESFKNTGETENV